MLPRYLDHYARGVRVWPLLAALAIAALLLLSACASRGLVDAQTPQDTVTVSLGDAAVLLGVRADDIVGLLRAGALTPDEANAKLAEIGDWLQELEDAKIMVDAGNLAAGDRTVAGVKAFLLELKDYMTAKGWLGGG